MMGGYCSYVHVYMTLVMTCVPVVKSYAFLCSSFFINYYLDGAYNSHVEVVQFCACAWIMVQNALLQYDTILSNFFVMLCLIINLMCPSHLSYVCPV